MSRFLITYDLDTEREPDYDALKNILEPIGAVRVQKSVWLIDDKKDRLNEVFETMRTIHITDFDRLIVAEVSRMKEHNSMPSIKDKTD